MSSLGCIVGGGPLLVAAILLLTAAPPAAAEPDGSGSAKPPDELSSARGPQRQANPAAAATDAKAASHQAASKSSTKSVASEPGREAVAVKAALVLKVFEPATTAATVIAKTRELDGFFLRRTPKRLVLKVPAAGLDVLIDAVEAEGKVLSKSYQSESLRGDLERVRRRISSQRNLLEKYFEILEEANAKAVVSVQQRITGLIQRIETLKGRQRKLKNRSRLAELVVDFRFRERTPPAPGESSFPWLNRVGLAPLYEEFAR